MSLRAVVVGLSALVILAGCGTAHPGAAAIVDGQEITLSQVDDIATSMCSAFAEQSDRQDAANAEQARAAGQDPAAIPAAERARQGEIRTLVVETLVHQVAFEGIMEDEGIAIAYDDYRASPEELEFFEENFDDTELIVQFAEADRHNTIATERLAEAWDIDLASLQTPEDAAAFYQRVAEQVDLTIDPRFGIQDDLVRTGSRSVSVLAPGDADPETGLLDQSGDFNRPEVTVGRLC